MGKYHSELLMLFNLAFLMECKYRSVCVRRIVCDVRQTTDRAVDKRYIDLCVYGEQCVTSDKQQTVLRTDVSAL